MQGIGEWDSAFTGVFHPEMDGCLHVDLFDIPTAIAVCVWLIHKLRHERTGDAGRREGQGLFEELELISVRV
jgi:hypothetical protein